MSELRGHGAKFSRRQEAAIIGLLTQPTIDAAANHAKIAASTLRRWLLLPSFQAAYREARAEAVRQAVARLQQSCSKAVDALIDVLEDPDAGHYLKISAAKIILETAMKGITLEDFDARLAAIEAAIAERNGHHALTR